MAKKNKNTPKQAEKSVPNKEDAKKSGQGWIPIRSGMIAIGVVSLAMVAFTAYTTIPALGFWEGSLWALITGGSLWLVFLLALLFHRFMRRGSDR